MYAYSLFEFLGKPKVGNNYNLYHSCAYYVIGIEPTSSYNLSHLILKVIL